MKELGQDWVSYQKVLFPRKKSKQPVLSPSVAVISRGEKVVRVCSGLDDLNLLTGGRTDEALNQIPSGMESVVVDTVAFDAAMEASLREGRIFDQIELIREGVTPNHGQMPKARTHFLFQCVESVWGRFMPSSFGIYLSFTEETATSLLVLFKRGKIDQFDDPDLSSLSEERRAMPDEVVKYLRETYGVPVQGFRLGWEEWTELCEAAATGASPWKRMAQGLKSQSISLHPFRWGVASMLGARGHLGL